MLDIIPSESLHKKLHLEITDLAVPSNPSHVWNEKPSNVNRHTKLKIIVKKKGSPSKAKSKKRAKFGQSSQKDSHISSAPNSGSQPTSRTHSFDAPIRVSKSLTHTHGESPYNLPPSSHKDGVGIEQSSLEPPRHIHESSWIPTSSSKHNLWPLPQVQSILN